MFLAAKILFGKKTGASRTPRSRTEKKKQDAAPKLKRDDTMKRTAKVKNFFFVKILMQSINQSINVIIVFTAENTHCFFTRIFFHPPLCK